MEVAPGNGSGEICARATEAAYTIATQLRSAAHQDSFLRAVLPFVSRRGPRMDSVCHPGAGETSRGRRHRRHSDDLASGIDSPDRQACPTVVKPALGGEIAGYVGRAKSMGSTPGDATDAPVTGKADTEAGGCASHRIGALGAAASRTPPHQACLQHQQRL